MDLEAEAREILIEEYLSQVGCTDNTYVRKEFERQIDNGDHDYVLKSMILFRQI